MSESGSRGEETGDRSATPAEVESLRSDFERTDLSKHLAFFYRTLETQQTVAAAFVEHGLRTGHRCLYFFDSNTKAAVERSLRRAGIAVDERVAAGDLVVRNGGDAYREADFDPDRLIELLGEECHDSVAAGYEGLYVAGELSWSFHTDLTYDHVVDFEADFEAESPDLPVTALCQYDLNQFDTDSVAKALWTHEQVVYRYTVCENPYYVPPETFRSGGAGRPDTHLMLEQLHTLSEANRRIERREQRLAVVNRVLRHNVRNELNVVYGALDRLGDDLPEGEYESAVAEATDHIDDIVEIADRARFVQETLETTEVRRTALTPTVARAVDRVAEDHPEAEVAVEGTEDVRVVADANLDVALSELVSYAVRQEGGDPSRVLIRIDDRPPDRVGIDVTYPGGPVWEAERRIVDRGSETKLDHCRGLELWLAKWVVEAANGRLVFPDEGDVCVRIELYREFG